MIGLSWVLIPRPSVMDLQSSSNLAGAESSMRQVFQMGPQRIFHRASLVVPAWLFLQLTDASHNIYSMSTLYFGNRAWH